MKLDKNLSRLFADVHDIKVRHLETRFTLNILVQKAKQYHVDCLILQQTT